MSIVEYVPKSAQGTRHPNKLFISKYLSRKIPPKAFAYNLAGEEAFLATRISKPQMDAVRIFMNATAETFLSPNALPPAAPAAAPAAPDFQIVRKGCVIADSAGVGKTFEIVGALVAHLFENAANGVGVGRNLIVVPKDGLFATMMAVLDEFMATDAAEAMLPTPPDVFTAFSDISHRLEETDSDSEPAGFAPRPVDGIFITTYATMASRAKEISAWVGGAAHTLNFFAFDESQHLNDITTESAKGALHLIRTHPNSRLLASSGTPFSKISDLGVLGEKLNMWTPGSHQIVAKAVSGRKGGIYVATLLAQTGCYISRILNSADMLTETVVKVDASEANKRLYDRCASLMVKTIFAIEKRFASAANFRFIKARTRATSLAFYREMLALLRLDDVVREGRAYIEAGFAIVIALQSTGESYICKETKGIVNIPLGLLDYVSKVEGAPLWKDLADEWLDVGLPTSTVLDAVIDAFGGMDEVADMTGRTKFVTKDPSSETGERICTRRAKAYNAERQLFQSGAKIKGAISGASSEGFDLHPLEPGDPPRAMLMLQEAYTDTQVRQTHARVARTGQSSTPVIVSFVLNDVCEQRFSKATSSRNSSAIQHGDIDAVVLGSELADMAGTVRGVKALEAVFRALSSSATRENENVQYLVAKLGFASYDDYATYRSTVRSRLEAVGCFDFLFEHKKKRRRAGGRGGGGGRRRGDNDDDDDDDDDDDGRGDDLLASEAAASFSATMDATATASSTSADAVRVVLNSFFHIPLAFQLTLAKHVHAELVYVNSFSTHKKPCQMVYAIVRDTPVPYGAVRALKLKGVQTFASVEKLCEEGGGEWFVTGDSTSAFCVVKIDDVLWRISPKACIAHPKPIFRAERCAKGVAAAMWNENVEDKMMLANVPPKLIPALRGQLAGGMKLQMLKADGDTLVGFTIRIEDLHDAVAFLASQRLVEEATRREVERAAEAEEAEEAEEEGEGEEGEEGESDDEM